MDNGPGDDPNGFEEYQMSPSYRAAEALAYRVGQAIWDGDEVRRILSEEPGRLGGSGVFGPDLLIQAIERGQIGAAAALLEDGVPAWSIDENGGTALMAAAWYGHLEVARMLLDAGADPDSVAEEDGSYGDPYDSGRCALYCALYKGHHDLVDLLEPVTRPEVRDLAYQAVAKRRDDDARDEAENGPRMSEATIELFMAAQNDQLHRLHEAIAAGADTNAVLKPEATNRLYGSTPLSFAAARGRTDLVEALLAAGADPGLKNHDGRTAADFAALNGHAEIAARLRAACLPPAADRG